MFKSRKRSLLNYIEHWWMKIYLVLFFSILYSPILVLIIFSFNDSKRNIIWRGSTFKYYEKAWNNSSLIEAFSNSLIIAVTNMIVATLLGVLAAILLWRFRFWGKSVYDGVLALPIVIPEICMGVALLVFFNRWWPSDLVWPLNLVNIAVAHITFSFPFVAIIIRGQLVNINRELEQAAMDLGANEWQAMKDILLPSIKPAVIAGALISFTLSLDDFVITYFTSGPNSITLPVKINSMLRFSVTPEVNAASTILILITIVSVFLAMRLQKKRLT